MTALEEALREIERLKAEIERKDALLREVIGEADTDILVYDTEEPAYCFFCGEEYSYVDSVNHADDCVVLKIHKALTEEDK